VETVILTVVLCCENVFSYLGINIDLEKRVLRTIFGPREREEVIEGRTRTPLHDEELYDEVLLG
jgi:hypothetical protein